MEIRLNNFFYFLLFLLISCNGNSQSNKNTSAKKESEKLTTINFSDKKYTSGYFTTIDESNLADHPIYSFLDCFKEGYFTVHAIPIEDHTKYYWEKLYPTQIKDFEEEKKYVKKTMAEDPYGYTLFAYWIESKYIKRKEKCTEESLVIDSEAIAKIYYYDKNTHKWSFLKDEKSDILPPYRDNYYNENEFPQIFNSSFTPENSYQNYLSILLYSYLNKHINKKNIVSDNSKQIIESIISNYSHQEDYYKASFFNI